MIQSTSSQTRTFLPTSLSAQDRVRGSSWEIALVTIGLYAAIGESEGGTRGITRGWLDADCRSRSSPSLGFAEFPPEVISAPRQKARADDACASVYNILSPRGRVSCSREQRDQPVDTYYITGRKKRNWIEKWGFLREIRDGITRPAALSRPLIGKVIRLMRFSRVEQPASPEIFITVTSSSLARQTTFYTVVTAGLYKIVPIWANSVSHRKRIAKGALISSFRGNV